MNGNASLRYNIIATVFLYRSGTLFLLPHARLTYPVTYVSQEWEWCHSATQGSSSPSVSLETLANDVQVEEETHLKSFTDMLQASMQDFLMAIQAKTWHKYNKLQPAA